jgi:hypothetical protein
MTTMTQDQAGAGPTGSGRRRWRRAFRTALVVAGTLLLVLVSRSVNSNTSVSSRVVQQVCQGRVCVRRVHSPDLLLVPGNRSVQVAVRDAHGQLIPRVLAEADPFDDYSDVKVGWKDGGVTLTDGTAVLGWDADAIAGLDD